MSKFEEYLEAVRSVVEMDESKPTDELTDETYFYAPSSEGALDDLFSEEYDLMKSAVKKFKRVTPEFLKKYGKTVVQIDRKISNDAEGGNLWGKGYDFVNHIGIKVAFENIGKKAPKL